MASWRWRSLAASWLWQHQQHQPPRLLRPFSATAPEPPAPPENAHALAAAKKRKKAKKRFFDVAQYLANWGIGAKLAKTHWDPLCYYVVTDVKLYKDGCHGAAWGIFHNSDSGFKVIHGRGFFYSGASKTGQAEKIGGVNKHCWKYIEDFPEKKWKRLHK